MLDRVRVLDPGRPGRSLAASSMPVPLEVPAQSLRDAVAVAVAGGSQFLAWAELRPADRRNDWVLAAYDARTGRRLRCWST